MHHPISPEAIMNAVYALGFLALCAIAFVAYIFFLKGQQKLQDDLARHFRGESGGERFPSSAA